MTDLSSLSDADLQALYAKKTAKPDVSKMSDDELKAAYAAKNPGFIEDAANSIASGLGNATISTLGGLGDLREAAGKGVDYVGSKIGVDLSPIKTAASAASRVIPPLGMMANAPTSEDVKSTVTDPIVSPDYQPKHLTGSYLKTTAEFAPGILMGGEGGLASRAIRNVVLPAIGSETAGQLTKGTEAEPYARIGGAFLSPTITSAARRVVTPIQSVSPERAALADALRREGVDLTAGQATGSKPLQWMESTLGDLPGSGGRAAAIQTRQGEQFTAAAMRRAGETSNRADTAAVNAAHDRIGNNFDQLAARNDLHMDRPFATDLTDSVREYNSLVSPSSRAPVVENIVNDIAQHAGQNNGVISGEFYQALRSRLDRMSRSAAADPQLSTALRDIRTSLDDAMERTLAVHNPADLGAWREARNQYRNLLVIDKAAGGAGSATAEGLLSPSQLKNAVQTVHGRTNYVRGQGDYNELAHAGEAILKPLPNSGTAPRMYVQGLLHALSGGLGGVAGAPIGAALPGMVAGAALPATVGRALMSAPVQRYLGNRVLGPAALGARRNEALAAALLAHQGNSTRQ